MHNHIYGAHIEEFVQSYFPYEYHASSPVLRFESEVHDHEKAPISVAEEVDEDSGEKKYQIRVACIYTPAADSFDIFPLANAARIFDQRIANIIIQTVSLYIRTHRCEYVYNGIQELYRRNMG